MSQETQEICEFGVIARKIGNYQISEVGGFCGLIVLLIL